MRETLVKAPGRRNSFVRRHDFIDRGGDKRVNVGRDEWKLENWMWIKDGS